MPGYPRRSVSVMVAGTSVERYNVPYRLSRINTSYPGRSGS